MPRILFCFFNNYEPISDFYNYYNFGRLLVSKNYNEISQIISNYGIPKFGGVAIFYGIIAELFSVKLLGFQIANCIMTSFICILIYLIGKTYNKIVGITGCMLYAFYPANIISSQITTNHHGAILFALLGIYIFFEGVIKSNKRGMLYVVLSGCLFAISDFIHPSVIIILIAVILFTLFLMVSKYTYRRFCIETLKKLVITILTYNIVIFVGLHIMISAGIITDLYANSNLAKIVVGLNYETRGSYSQEDYEYILRFPKERQSEEALSLIKSRLNEHSLKETALLVRDKVYTLWWAKDDYFWWYHAGKDNELNTNNLMSENEKLKYNTFIEFINSYQDFDLIFLRIIFLFALFGIILRKRSDNCLIDLVLWAILGWMAIHIFIEVQTRYRYLGTPYIFIIASIGIYEVIRLLKQAKLAKKEKIPCS